MITKKNLAAILFAFASIITINAYSMQNDDYCETCDHNDELCRQRCGGSLTPYQSNVLAAKMNVLR